MDPCEQNEARIHRLVENELSAQEAAELKRHMDSCEQCAETMRAYQEMKSFIEGKLASEVELSDEAQFVRSALARTKHKRGRRRLKKVLKIGFMTAAAGLAMILVGGFLFFKFYFARTFANDLTDSVLRCSTGLMVRGGTADWTPLKAAHRLKPGEQLLTPDGARSFVSFNGIRALSEEASEFEIEGSRSLAFGHGDIALECDGRKQPLKIQMGAASLSTSDSSIRISGREGVYSVSSISGTVEVKMPGSGKVQHLETGQAAMIAGDQVRFSSSSAKDLFAFKRVGVLERIKERFRQVMAKYADRIPAVRLGMNHLVHPLSQTAGWENGLQFVSYISSGLAAAPINNDVASNDGSMIAFVETSPGALTGVARVVRLDDLENPWDISQEYQYRTRSMLPTAWTPDDRHVLFQVETGPAWDEKGPTGNFKLVLAPIDPAEGPTWDFASPFYDIPLPLPLPVGKTISPSIAKLPWGDAMVCANWGNLAYIPVEEDGQAVTNAPGIFLTNFNPRHAFVMGGGFSPSGSMMDFTAVENLEFNRMNTYILYDVEDIIDGFAEPPRSLDDPRIKRVAPTDNVQFTGGFSFDESLVFVHEDVNHAFSTYYPTMLESCDFDILYISALPGEPGKPVQIHLSGNQMFLEPSPEGNRICYSNFEGNRYELRVVSFDIEADIYADLGGVLIDNSGTNLIIPPGALQRNFTVEISTPFSIGEEAELPEGESQFFAMRLLDVKGLENPQFIEPMTLTIRYTDEEVAGLDEGMLEIYYYDESDPSHPIWVPLGGTVDPEHNEITVQIQHFSKFAVGQTGKKK
jgi:ferric-dicitrate binding protein FerR (iron transport regulator)